MRYYTKRALLFIFINFICLGLGNFPTMKGVSSDWYQLGNQAPWTPPGWVFGFAWSIIMVCYGFFMTSILDYSSFIKKRKFIRVYILSCILNILWCYLFFGQQLILLGLVNIIVLFILVFFFAFVSIKDKKPLSFVLILPYFLWLIIATSLNVYFYIYN